MTEPRDNTVAIYRRGGAEPEISLKTNIFETLYQVGNRAFNFTPGSLRALKHLQQKGEITWLKTPQSHYHVWHICTCSKCCPEVLGSIYGERSGGRVWDHSQASFNEHLRFVGPDDLGTFPTVEESEQ